MRSFAPNAREAPLKLALFMSDIMNEVNFMLSRSLGSVFTSLTPPLNVVVVDVLMCPGGVEGRNLAFF